MSLVGLRVGPFEIVEEAAVPEPGRWFRARRVTGPRQGPDEVWLGVAEAPRDRVLLQGLHDTLRALDDPRLPTAVAFYEGSGAVALDAPEGVALSAVLGRGEVTLATALDVAIDLAETLQHVHHRGGFHGRISADRVWIAEDGALRLWGLGGEAPASGWEAPELARAEPLDERTDQWSLAALVASLLTGRTPWLDRAAARAGDVSSLLAPVQRWPAVGRLLGTMLDPRPERRLASMQVARQELLALARQLDSRSERRELAALAGRFREEPPVVEVAAAAEPRPAAASGLPREDLPVVRPDVGEEVPLAQAADGEATVLYQAGEIEAMVSGEPAPPRTHRADTEATLLFHDQPTAEEFDTAPRAVEEALFSDDEEDSMAQTLAVPTVAEPLEEPSSTLDPLPVVAADAPLVDDDESSGPYHQAIDLSEIDTAPREQVDDTRPTAPLPRPLTPPERAATALLVALGLLLLVWTFVRLAT